jgi:hypothetical protein
MRSLDPKLHLKCTAAYVTPGNSFNLGLQKVIRLRSAEHDF